MAFELVDTSQLFARMAARIDPLWLLDVADHLVRRSYSAPHWSERAGRASVKETCTLFGLTIARDRSVDYAAINPKGARRLFIDYALIRGEYTSRGVFQEKNRAVQAQASQIRARARRSDLLADDGALFAFFEARVPESVVNGKTFEDWREVAEKRDPALLCFSLEHIFADDTDLHPADYPDTLTLHGAKLPVAYRFDPACDDDGITLTIPLVMVPQLDPGELDWTIPGWLVEKVEALLHELPKATRRELGSLPELASRLAPRLTPFRGPMLPALSQALREATGVDVPPAAWRTDLIPPYLRTTVALTDPKGEVVAQGRKVDELFKKYGAKARDVWQTVTPPKAFERKGVTSWDFGDLPEYVTRRVGNTDVRSYPALVDRGAAVDLELMQSAPAADAATRLGLRRLAMLASRQAITAITPRLPLSLTRTEGAIARRADDDTFRTVLLHALVDVAFQLGREHALPRTQAAWQERLKAGGPRLHAAAAHFGEAIDAVRPDLQKTLTALRNASRHLAAKAAITDIHAQLDQLLPPDLMAHALPADLAHFPRYLRAITARLDRAIANPKKDADKLAPLLPVWTRLLQKRKTAKDPAEAFEALLMFEELRVATFAPELKPAYPVSLQKVAAAVAALRTWD